MAASEQASSLNLVLADRQLSGNRYGRFGRREYPVATGRFQESEFHWPLSGYEFEARTFASRPIAVTHWQQWERLKSGINQPSRIQIALSILTLHATQRGKRIANLVKPLSDVTETSPPWAWTIERVIANPRPEPSP